MGLSCAGAPIFDANGILAAILDTSSIVPGLAAQSHALALAATITSPSVARLVVSSSAAFPRPGIALGSSTPSFLPPTSSGQIMCELDRTDHILATNANRVPIRWIDVRMA